MQAMMFIVTAIQKKNISSLFKSNKIHKYILLTGFDF